MIALDIAHHRLYNQRIVHEKFELPSQVTTWLGAMQAQDYASVKWAVGLGCVRNFRRALEGGEGWPKPHPNVRLTAYCVGLTSLERLPGSSACQPVSYVLA